MSGRAKLPPPVKRPNKATLVRAARRLHAEDGMVEVDDGAKVSSVPEANGAYVQAWVWVSYDDVLPKDRV